MTYQIRLATAADTDALVALYHSMIGTPGCTWSELYPSAENVEQDLASNELWVLEVDGELAGAVSVGDPNSMSSSGDVADLGWEPQNPIELARLVVAHGYQGRGLANVLIQHALGIARSEGFDGAVLLVHPTNLAARHLYAKYGFTPDGEIYAWNHNWLRYQLSF